MSGYLKSLAKKVVNSVRRQRSQAKVRSEAAHVTGEQIQSDLKRLGVSEGDTLFVHASLKSLGYVVGGAQTVIDALQAAVGPSGNLLLATYYLPGGTIEATCRLTDYRFDPRVHGTHMGRLPETFLAQDGIHRSLHPTHSVSAWGRDAARLTRSHHLAPSVFGEGSPWQLFRDTPNAKVLGLGVGLRALTFFHLLEDDLGEAFPVDIWQEEHMLPCIDSNDKVWEVPVRSFRPEVTAHRIDHPNRADLRDYFERELESAGVMHSGRVGQCISCLMPAQPFYAHIKALAAEGITVYSTPEDISRRPLP